MAFNTNPGRQSFTATSGQTVFDFNFKIFVETDIKVYLTPVGSTPDDTTDLLIYGSEYTVTIDGDNGGAVTLLTGATLNDTLILVRSLPRTRTTSYVTNGDLKATTLNLDQDYQTYLLIDGFDVENRAIVLPTTDVNMDRELPSTVPGGFLKAKQDGAGFEYGEFTTDATAVIVGTISDMLTVDGSQTNKVTVLGYNTKGDGGGGLFYWDAVSTETQNSGTIFGSGTGRWKRVYTGAVNVKWFGAKGDFDGTTGTDDTSSIQNAIDWTSANGIRLDITDGKYKLTGAIQTRTNLHMYFTKGAIIYPTKWSVSGSILSNVNGPNYPTAIQSNILIENPQLDGQYLPYDGLSNDNAIGFTRGASNVVIKNAVIKNFNFSFIAGGAGGKAVNFEQGVTDAYVDYIFAENCGVAFFVQGLEGTWANGATKETTRIIVDNIIAENCESVVAVLGINTTQDPDGDANDQMVLINNVVFHNCGHMPNRPVTEGFEKSGVIVLGEAQNVHITNVKGNNDSSYPSSYPAVGSNVVGAGLSGPIGAIVWGWGRNITISNIEYHGNCDSLIQINRARAIGDDASPDGIIENVYRFDVTELRHYGTTTYALNIQSGILKPTNANVTGNFTNIYTDTITNIISPELNGFTNIYVKAVSAIIGSSRVTIEGRAHDIYNNRNTFATLSNGTVLGNTNPYTEYGIFTPVLKDAPTGNSATAQISTGRYTKIGNRVFFTINLINITTTGLTSVSPVFITGLPYTSINYTATALSPCKVIGSLVASTTGISASPIAGQSYLALYNESTTGYEKLLVSAITSGAGDLMISGSYEVAF